MKVYELLSTNASLIRKMNQSGVRAESVGNLKLYEEFVRLRNDGLKVRYIARHLAEEFNTSDRRVFRVVAEMEREI